MSKYLDDTGLAYFWSKIKAYGNAHWGGGGSGTSVPTANTLAEFDSTAHMNSTDMTASEVSDFVDSLEGQGANLADYVVEVGNENNWEYRKWNSGIFEMWRVYSGAPTGGTHYVTIGGLYGYRIAGLGFPSSCKPINADYHVDDTWIIDNGFAMSAGTVTTKNTTNFGVYCLASSGNQTTVNVNLYVTGRWK